VGYLRVLKHCHSASSVVEHVCTDVEGIDTAFGSGMEIDQELKLFDKSVKEIVCVLLWSRSLRVSELSDLFGEVRTQA
jgi:hypothetical protein